PPYLPPGIARGAGLPCLARVARAPGGRCACAAHTRGPARDQGADCRAAARAATAGDRWPTSDLGRAERPGTLGARARCDAPFGWRTPVGGCPVLCSPLCRDRGAV